MCVKPSNLSIYLYRDLHVLLHLHLGIFCIYIYILHLHLHLYIYIYLHLHLHLLLHLSSGQLLAENVFKVHRTDYLFLYVAWLCCQYV